MSVWTRSFQKIYKLTDNVGQQFTKTCLPMSTIYQNRRYTMVIDPKEHKGFFNPAPMVSKAELDYFDSVLPKVIKVLTEEQETPEERAINERFIKFLEYVVPTGKRARGLFILACYTKLKNNYTEDERFAANVMAWTMEMLQGHFLNVDDIADHSTVRRGQLCWHKREEIGLDAISDSLYLSETVFFLIKKYYGNHKNYVKMIDMIHDSIRKSTYGQILDVLPDLSKKPNLEHFTWERCKFICNTKTAHYTLYLPIRLTMLISEFPSTEELDRRIEDITMKIGVFYQIQDDYLDCFGVKSKKGGNDITEGKCTWLAVKALERVTPEQKKLMIENYGISDPKAFETVKKLYEDLKLPELFKEFQNEQYNSLHNKIEGLPRELPRDVLMNILSSLYGRGI